MINCVKMASIMVRQLLASHMHKVHHLSLYTFFFLRYHGLKWQTQHKYAIIIYRGKRPSCLSIKYTLCLSARPRQGELNRLACYVSGSDHSSYTQFDIPCLPARHLFSPYLLPYSTKSLPPFHSRLYFFNGLGIY